MKTLKSVLKFIIRKFNSNLKLISLIYPLAFLIGCTRYATEEELGFLKNLEQEVYQLEYQNKILKEKTLELNREKYDLIRKMNECRKKLDSIQTILPETSKNEGWLNEN